MNEDQEISKLKKYIENAKSYTWLNLKDEQWQSLINDPADCLLLLDNQRENALAIAAYLSSNIICENSNYCGKCRSCHLIQNTIHPDILFFDEVLKIEEIREILEKIYQTPALEPLRIIVLGNIDLYNDSSLNALLKTLEEPSAHNKFILSAPSRRAVKPTILSRARAIPVNKASHNQAINWLTKKHNWEIEDAKKILELSNDNPFSSLQWEDNKNPLEIFPFMAAYCANPQKHRHFLQLIEKIPEKQRLDVISLNLNLLIEKLQLDKNIVQWQNLPSFDKANPDLNRLHSLNAALNRLRRPNRQQLGMSINITTLFLQFIETRNLIL